MIVGAYSFSDKFFIMILYMKMYNQGTLKIETMVQQSGEDIIYLTDYKSFKRVARNKENVDQLILINFKIINCPPVRMMRNS